MVTQYFEYKEIDITTKNTNDKRECLEDFDELWEKTEQYMNTRENITRKNTK